MRRQPRHLCGVVCSPAKCVIAFVQPEHRAASAAVSSRASDFVNQSILGATSAPGAEQEMAQFAAQEEVSKL